jgi:hypothetical protein
MDGPNVVKSRWSSSIKLSAVLVRSQLPTMTLVVLFDRVLQDTIKIRTGLQFIIKIIN